MDRFVRTCIVLAVLALAVPFLVTAVPRVLDFPNHMARMWLIAGGASEPPLNTIYAVDWSRAVVNIGIDLAAAALGGVLAAEMVAQVMLAMSLMLPAVGAVALSRVLSGRWHAFMLLIPLSAWNFCFVLGFMNQQIALGLALLAVASEQGKPERGRRTIVAIRSVVAAIVAVIHPFGTLAYAVTLAAVALGPEPSWRKCLPRAMFAGAIPVAVLTVIIVFAPQAPGSSGSGYVASLPAWPDYTTRIAAVMAPYSTYLPVPEPVLGLIGTLALLAAIRGGSLQLHHGLALAAVCLAVLALAGPVNLGDTSQLDQRLASLAWLLFIVAVQPGPMSVLAGAGFPAVLLGASLVRAGLIAGIWLAGETDRRSIEEAIEPIPPGANVLVLGEAEPIEWLPRNPWRRAAFHTSQRHFPAVVIIRRRAFIPVLFGAAGKQPLRVLPPMMADHRGHGSLTPRGYRPFLGIPTFAIGERISTSSFS